MTLEELFKAIGDWGEERGINDPVMQFAKINEEIGELAHELCRGKCGSDNSVPSAETMDAIGDILVTVIIFSKIIGVDPAFCLASAYGVIKGRDGKTVNGCFIKAGE